MKDANFFKMLEFVLQFTFDDLLQNASQDEVFQVLYSDMKGLACVQSTYMFLQMHLVIPDFLLPLPLVPDCCA